VVAASVVAALAVVALAAFVVADVDDIRKVLD